MTTRARLRYFDDTGTERIIGRINETGGGSINEFTLRNSGTQYTKSTIVSSKELFGSFPTEASEVTEQNNASGPEIFVDVYDSVNGTWKTRDRVYAESQGVVNNDGSLKHKRLYGFEKYTGKQKVNISTETGADSSPVTTNIEEALDAVLPNGYVVDAPGDVSIPTVENYTFIGERSQAYKELRENYEWLIFFTSETDGSGNYLVKFQPLGYGGQVDTFEKGVDPLFFNKWTKDDELRRITEAEVVGTDSEDKTVKATASTNPNDGRFIRRNVGYLQSQTEAQNIAENLIAADNDGDPPESVEHGKITVPLDQPPANNLNASVQVINSELNIDDRFTVVEQTDYFHQSQVEYSFEFEKELTNRDQQDKKDLKARNAELISSEETNVGEQKITTKLEILDVDTTNNIFTVTNNQSSKLTNGDKIEVRESTGNDAQYTVDSFSYDSGQNETNITVNENVSDSTADGFLIIFKGETGSTPSDTGRDPQTGLDNDKQGEGIVTATYIPKKKEDRGFVEIPTTSSGENEEVISFSTSFESAPNVQVTPANLYPDQFRIRNVTSSEFTLGFKGAPANLEQDFYWKAENNEDIESITISADVPPSPSTSNQPDDTEAFFDGVHVDFSVNNFSGDSFSIDYSVVNNSTGVTLTSGSEFVSNQASINVNDDYDTSEVSEFDNLEVQITETDFSDDFITGDGQLSMSSVVFTINTRTEHVIGEDIDTEDFNHGGPNDPSGEHTTSGTTDEKNIETGKEEDTSR